MKKAMTGIGATTRDVIGAILKDMNLSTEVQTHMPKNPQSREL